MDGWTLNNTQSLCSWVYGILSVLLRKEKSRMKKKLVTFRFWSTHSWSWYSFVRLFLIKEKVFAIGIRMLSHNSYSIPRSWKMENIVLQSINRFPITSQKLIWKRNAVTLLPDCLWWKISSEEFMKFGQHPGVAAPWARFWSCIAWEN